MHTDYLALLRLMQLADSALPVGATAHSFGLETLVAEEYLEVQHLEAFLKDYLEESLPGLELIFVESGGDNLAAAFSPELVDVFIYVIDVAGGDKIPRKGGPGITRSDLLVINKIDLAPYVGASLEVMKRDAGRMRGKRPFIFTNLKDGTGLDAVLTWVDLHLKTPADQRRSIIDAHAPYTGQAHTHDHEHHIVGHTHTQ